PLRTSGVHQGQGSAGSSTTAAGVVARRSGGPATGITAPVRSRAARTRDGLADITPSVLIFGGGEPGPGQIEDVTTRREDPSRPRESPTESIQSQLTMPARRSESTKSVADAVPGGYKRSRSFPSRLRARAVPRLRCL